MQGITITVGPQTSNVPPRNDCAMPKTTITVGRPTCLVGAFNLYRIYVDNIEIGRIANAKVETFEIEPGRHIFHCNEACHVPLTGPVPFEVNEGENCNFLLRWKGLFANPLQTYKVDVWKGAFVTY